MNNIGRIFEILFIHVSENLKVKILGEIGNIEVPEIFKFFSLFDSHLFDSFAEESLVLGEDA